MLYLGEFYPARYSLQMKFLVIFLCIGFCRVFADPEIGKTASEEEEDVIVKVIKAMPPPPRVLLDAPKIVHPGEKLPGVEDQNNYHSLPLRYRGSDNSESGELGTFGRPSGVWNPRSAAESSSRKWKQRPRINLVAPDDEFHILSERGSKSEKSTDVHLADTLTSWNNSSRRKLLRREKRGDPPSSDSFREFYDSRSKWSAEMHLLPETLRTAMVDTDALEEQLLMDLALKRANKTLIDALKSEYKEAQRAEKWLLKHLVEGAQSQSQAADLIAHYKTLRKGEAWSHTKLDPIYSEFFNTSSDQLNEFNELQKSQLDVDAYVNGTLKYPDEEEYNKAMLAKDEYKNLSKPVEAAEKQLEQENSETSANDAGQTPSLSVRKSLVSGLPTVLRTRIKKTDETEEELIQDYWKAPQVPPEILSLYNLRKNEEREVLKQVLKEEGPHAPQTLQLYKAVRKGEAWNYTKVSDKFKEFFQRPSAALVEYDALKKDELSSVDAFLEASDDKEPIVKLFNNSRTRSAESLSVHVSLLGELPDMLHHKMEATDAAERALLNYYAKSTPVPSSALDVYNALKKEERLLLKDVLKEAGSYSPQFLNVYKAIRKGEASTHLKLDGALSEFFEKYSPALVEYKTLKRDEFASIDTFLIDQIVRVALEREEEDDEWAEEEDVLKSSAEEGSMNEKSERNIREQDPETYGTEEEMANIETAEGGNVVNVNEPDDILRSPDNVRVADEAPTNNTANQSENN